MTMMLRGEFETRRQAELTIERLVQEYEIDRDAIRVGPAGADNSAGVARAGSDSADGRDTDDARNDAALDGVLVVEVSLDAAAAETIRAAFAEFAASDVAEKP